MIWQARWLASRSRQLNQRLPNDEKSQRLIIDWQCFVGFKLCTAPYKGTTEFKNLCPVRAAWIIEHLKVR